MRVRRKTKTTTNDTNNHNTYSYCERTVLAASVYSHDCLHTHAMNPTPTDNTRTHIPCVSAGIVMAEKHEEETPQILIIYTTRARFV